MNSFIDEIEKALEDGDDDAVVRALKDDIRQRSQEYREQEERHGNIDFTDDMRTEDDFGVHEKDGIITVKWRTENIPAEWLGEPMTRLQRVGKIMTEMTFEEFSAFHAKIEDLADYEGRIDIKSLYNAGVDLRDDL